LDAEGKLADMVVLSQDLFTIDPKEIPKIVYQKKKISS